MKGSLLLRYALPFLLWFGLMVLAAMGLDQVLHQNGWGHVGRYLGIPGTLLIAVSFLYSLRKRGVIRGGSASGWLRYHEYLAWAGAVLVLVHAGIHFNAQLAWLATYMMLVNVASGLVGKFILKRAGETLQEKRASLLEQGLETSRVEERLYLDSLAYGLFAKWRVIHLPIAMIFIILACLHILAVGIFRG